MLHITQKHLMKKSTHADTTKSAYASTHSLKKTVFVFEFLKITQTMHAPHHHKHLRERVRMQTQQKSADASAHS